MAVRGRRRGAYWALVDDGVELAAHDYDLERRGRARCAAPADPRAEEIAAENILTSPSRAEATALSSAGMTELVKVGRVGKPHGLDGSFFVEHASEDDDALREGRDAARRTASRRRSSRSKRSRRPAGDPARPRGAARRRARGRRATSCRRPSEGEYYEFQLVGLEVEEEGGARARPRQRRSRPGRRTTCSSSTRASLLPLVDACVQQVDLEAGRILVRDRLRDA